MKNEKRVLAKFINGQYCLPSRQGICISSNENYSDYIPQIISVYGYDYIREDKIDTRFAKELTQDIVDGAIETCNNIIETAQKIADDMKKQKEEKQELKVGDTVVLKSGGPVMTVVRFDEDGDAICNWYEESEGFPYSQVHYPTSCLEKVENEHIGYDGRELDCDEVDCDMYNDINEKELAKEIAEKANFEFNENKRWVIPQIAFAEGAWWMYNELTK